MEKTQKNSTRKMIKLLLVVAGVVLFALAWAVVRPDLEEETTRLENENASLLEQVQQLRDMEANEATYIQQSEAYEKEIQEIIDKYPPNIKEEDVVLYARDISDGTAVNVTAITINPSNLLYALNAVDETAPVSTDAADELTEDLEGEAGDTAADAAAAPSENGLGILDESQVVLPDYNLFVLSVSYDFTSDYDDMKSVFARLMTNRNKRNVSGMSMTYDTENGTIIGNLEVNMYYMTGTDKIYEEPDAGTVIHGNENIFGTVNLP